MKNKTTLLLFLFLSIICITHSQTYISGGIFNDTTWISQNNPYIVIGDVVIFDNVTLTVNQGVIIKIKPDTKIDLRGNFIANGTIQDSIFIFVDTMPTINNFWDGFELGNSLSLNIDMNYVNAENADVLFDCTIASGNININNCNFKNNNYVVEGYNGVDIYIDSSSFSNNNYPIANHNFTIISNSTFSNNLYGIYDAYKVDIDNCIFSNNTESGIMGNTSQGTIRNSYFINNNYGLELNIYNGTATENTYIDNNYFGCNNIGFKIGSCINDISHVFNNTFEKNITYDIYYLGQNNCDLGNNCWYYTNEDSIRTKIYDAYTDINVGIVSVLPIDSNCHSFQCTQSLGLNESINKIEKSYIYPNPASDLIYFSLDDILHIEVIDDFGHFVMKKIKPNKIDLSGLSNGLYFIKIVTSNQMIIEKIIKI